MPAQRVWFTHGPHAGMCVEDLVESFLKQEVRPEGLTPLVEVAWRKNFQQVFLCVFVYFKLYVFQISASELSMSSFSYV